MARLTTILLVWAFLESYFRQLISASAINYFVSQINRNPCGDPNRKCDGSETDPFPDLATAFRSIIKRENYPEEIILNLMDKEENFTKAVNTREIFLSERPELNLTIRAWKEGSKATILVGISRICIIIPRQLTLIGIIFHQNIKTDPLETIGTILDTEDHNISLFKLPFNENRPKNHAISFINCEFSEIISSREGFLITLVHLEFYENQGSILFLMNNCLFSWNIIPGGILFATNKGQNSSVTILITNTSFIKNIFHP